MTTAKKASAPTANAHVKNLEKIIDVLRLRVGVLERIHGYGPATVAQAKAAMDGKVPEDWPTRSGFPLE